MEVRTGERPATFFADAAEWARWLAANHATATELWMGRFKKHVPDAGLTWEDAVVEALCWGWIDSQVQRLDDDAVRQRWTPRNREHRRIATHWVVSAKQVATRERRLRQLVEDCAHGRLVPSQRYGTPPAWVVRAREAARAAGGPVAEPG